MKIQHDTAIAIKFSSILLFIYTLSTALWTFEEMLKIGFFQNALSYYLLGSIVLLTSLTLAC